MCVLERAAPTVFYRSTQMGIFRIPDPESTTWSNVITLRKSAKTELCRSKKAVRKILLLRTIQANNPGGRHFEKNCLRNEVYIKNKL
jgi:hypothetical protein